MILVNLVDSLFHLVQFKILVTLYYAILSDIDPIIEAVEVPLPQPYKLYHFSVNNCDVSTFPWQLY